MPGPRRRRLVPWLSLAGVLILVLLAAAAFLRSRGGQQSGLAQVRPPGIPGDVPTYTATLMGLDPVPHKMAPGFVLTDQNGHTVSLASLRGKVVVLEFMDSECHDICPIVSKEFVDAYRDLGAGASKVVFAAVNVNPYHRSVAAVRRFSSEHGLTAIPDWHFVTGPTASLKAVWRSYGIDVQAPSPNVDVVHTSIVYFISRSGVERYLAAPSVDHTAKGTAYLPPKEISGWGRGIALVARHLGG